MKFALRAFMMSALSLTALKSQGSEVPLKLYHQADLKPAEILSELRKPHQPRPSKNEALQVYQVKKKTVTKKEINVQLKPELPLPDFFLKRLGLVEVELIEKNTKSLPYTFHVRSQTEEGQLKGSMEIFPYKKTSLVRLNVEESTMPPLLFKTLLVTSAQLGIVSQKAPADFRK